MRLKVGCCGYPTAMQKYFETLQLVELQSTFYNLPRPSTMTKWRTTVPEGFEFSMKAWQVVTHPATSPSWHRTRLKVSDNEKDSYGFLKATEQNLDAWEKIMEVCTGLGCKVCVVQTPPSFGFSKDNAEAVRKFLGSVKPHVLIGWEPRGTWLEHQPETAKICRELGLIHVVDLLRRKPCFVGDIAYIRLHGLNVKEYD